MPIIKTPQEFDIIKNNLESMPIPKKILMVEPKYFDVEYGINPHMFDKNGTLNHINNQKAHLQWRCVRDIYKNLGFEVFTQVGTEHLPDMVFCANQTFPLVHNNVKMIILSNMLSDIRQKEVDIIADFFVRNGYKTVRLAERNSTHLFESMGDALWIPGKKFILGGYGFRSHFSMYQLLSDFLKVPIATFKLSNPKFYHLDTCLSILNDHTALYCEEAFDSQGLELLSSIFSKLIKIPLVEADSPGFSCNAHSPDQKHVILNNGSLKTHEMLVKEGFIPIEVDTSEFIKAGGSVFCMKLMFF